LTNLGSEPSKPDPEFEIAAPNLFLRAIDLFAGSRKASSTICSLSSFCRYDTAVKLTKSFSGRLPNGGLFEIAKVYPLDAVFDTPDDVPEDVSEK
jgi:hypothetical protein